MTSPGSSQNSSRVNTPSPPNVDHEDPKDDDPAPPSLHQSAVGQGLLRSGDSVLFDISNEFFDRIRVDGLAAHLLEGVGNGGHAFLTLLSTSPGASPMNVQLAFQVLIKWVEEKPGNASKANLYKVLKKINPTAAKKFKLKLLGPE